MLLHALETNLRLVDFKSVLQQYSEKSTTVQQSKNKNKNKVLQQYSKIKSTVKLLCFHGNLMQKSELFWHIMQS